MINMPRLKEGENYDSALPILVKDANKACNIDDDDFLIYCTGKPGSGKSNLMLWTQELYQGEKSSIRYIALCRKEFARAQREATQSERPRFLGNDEADILGREAMSRYNIDLVKYYAKCRAANLFHWWNNTSLEIMDKHFISDRVRGIILCTDKAKNKPRRYFYIKQEHLTSWMDKHKADRITLNKLYEICPKIAFYQGWFKPYTGKLKAAYLKIKNKETDDNSDNFYQTYYKKGADMLTPSEVCRAIGISKNTLIRYDAEMIINKVIQPNIDYEVAVTGRKLYTPDCVAKFEEMARLKAKEHNKKLQEGRKKNKAKPKKITRSR